MWVDACKFASTISLSRVHPTVRYSYTTVTTLYDIAVTVHGYSMWTCATYALAKLNVTDALN